MIKYILRILVVFMLFMVWISLRPSPPTHEPQVFTEYLDVWIFCIIFLGSMAIIVVNMYNIVKYKNFQILKWIKKVLIDE